MTDFSWHRRAQDAIAQGALTNSKRVSCHVEGVYPSHLSRGRGCHVWDTSGKKYVDHICGLGTNLLGYANERVNAAIFEQMQKGASLSLGTTLEVEAAEKLKELFPFVDVVKFLKSGSEACSAAIRIARAATGRPLVLSEGYHGWHDAFVSLTPPALGVPLEDGSFPIGYAMAKLGSYAFECGDVAAIIVEPIITDASRERIEWLKQLREECTKHGVLLIFDEIITGFRTPKYSVAAQCGIEPDLICLGKAIANGMPLAAVGGKYAVMNCGEYFVSSTYAGETLSLAAAKATMTLLQTKYSLEDLWLYGADFRDRFNALWPGGVTIEGYPSRGAFKGDATVKALFFQEACKAGVLFGPSFWFAFDHVGEYKATLDLCRDILTRVRLGEVKLEGLMPQSPFAQKVREKSA